MAHVQFTDVQDRPTEFLDVTSLTLDEFGNGIKISANGLRGMSISGKGSGSHANS